MAHTLVFVGIIRQMHMLGTDRQLDFQMPTFLLFEN